MSSYVRVWTWTASLAAPAMLALCLTLLHCRAPVDPPPAGKPRLILLLVVDQMRGDYLERFQPLFDSGLHRLLEEGVVFADTHHNHSTTSTSPGHATLVTGMYPARHGIVGNGWFDRESGEEVYSAADSDDERSPERLLSPTLGDRLKAAYGGRSKVFAASAKDRSAILMAGRDGDAAYWFDRGEGTFITASYYSDEEPQWLVEFHRRGLLDPYFTKPWEPLLSLEELAPYDVEPVERGWMDDQFPHVLGGTVLFPSGSFYRGVYSSPFMDAHLVEFAKALIDGEELGQDDYPDFLGVGLSALDAVGHGFGPHSPEFVDTLLRLDRSLGELLEFVDRRVGLDRVVVALSSDHGVAPVPELLRARGEDAKRFGTEEVLCLREAGRTLIERFGDEQWLASGLYLDRELLAEKGVSQDEMETVLKQALERCPRVVRVLRGAELLEPGKELDPLDPIAQLYANNYHPERSPDLILQLQPHTLAGSSSLSSHGTPYAYDTHVPWLLRLPDATGGTVTERTYTADVAPTLAALVGLEWQGECDGEDRQPLLPGPSTSWDLPRP